MRNPKPINALVPSGIKPLQNCFVQAQAKFDNKSDFQLF